MLIKTSAGGRVREMWREGSNTSEASDGHTEELRHLWSSGSKRWDSPTLSFSFFLLSSPNVCRVKRSLRSFYSCTTPGLWNLDAFSWPRGKARVSSFAPLTSQIQISEEAVSTSGRVFVAKFMHVDGCLGSDVQKLSISQTHLFWLQKRFYSVLVLKSISRLKLKQESEFFSPSIIALIWSNS